MRTKLLAIAMLISLGGACAARAETAAARAACTPSVLRLCPTEALTGDREGAKACLIRNLTRASPTCRAFVRAALGGADAGVSPTGPGRR
jgi:hypothetical protein